MSFWGLFYNKIYIASTKFLCARVLHRKLYRDGEFGIFLPSLGLILLLINYVRRVIWLGLIWKIEVDFWRELQNQLGSLFPLGQFLRVQWLMLGTGCSLSPTHPRSYTTDDHKLKVWPWGWTTRELKWPSGASNNPSWLLECWWPPPPPAVVFPQQWCVICISLHCDWIPTFPPTLSVSF